MKFSDMESLITALDQRSNELSARAAANKADIGDARKVLDNVVAQLAGSPTPQQIDQAGAALSRINDSLGGVESSLDQDATTLKAFGANPSNPIPPASTEAGGTTSGNADEV